MDYWVERLSRGLAMRTRILGTLACAGAALFAVSDSPAQLAGAQPAGAQPLPHGMSVFDVSALVRPGPGAFVSIDVLRALAGPPPTSARSYDFTHHEQLEADIHSFIAGKPPLPRAAPVARRATREVAAEHAAIKAAYNACPPDDDDDSEKCRLRAAAIDYDNSLADPLVESVPREKARHARPLTPVARHTLELRLNEIMAVLRVRVAQDLRGKRGAAAVKPVRVVIDPALGLNITSSYGGDTIRIGEGVITDIYFRALHRAINSRRIDAIDNNSLEDCDDCDETSRKTGVYARNFERLAYATQRFPGFRLRAVSRHWLGGVLLKSCPQYPLAERADLSRHLLEGPDGDLREIFDTTAILRYLPCATDGRMHISPAEAETYADEIRGGEDMNEEVMEQSYIPLLFEFVRTNTQVSAELLKAYLFLLAHESYHQWVSDSILQQVEFEADAHAARLYLQVYKQIDPNAWFKAVKVPPQLGAGGPDLQRMTDDVLGRDPVNLLREVYSGTEFYDGSWSHPPVPQRVARVKTLIESGRQATLCKALIEMRDASHGSGSSDLDLTACRRSAHP
jgi:hypothetical protein